MGVGDKVRIKTTQEEGTLERWRADWGVWYVEVNGHTCLQYPNNLELLPQIAESYIREWGTGPAWPLGCEHSWSEYIGFTQAFQFCTKCDTKRT